MMNGDAFFVAPNIYLNFRSMEERLYWTKSLELMWNIINFISNNEEELIWSGMPGKDHFWLGKQGNGKVTIAELTSHIPPTVGHEP